MSQAFLNGFRASSNMGMGNVRTPMMRSNDQNGTQSGNPRLAYNMPRMNSGAIASPAQQMQANDQNMFAAQQQAMQGMPPQAMRNGIGNNPNMAGFMGAPQGMGGMGPEQMGMAPSKPMRVRMPIMNPPGAIASQVQQMPVHTQQQRAQYARPALSSINSQGRRVYAL